MIRSILTSVLYLFFISISFAGNISVPVLKLGSPNMEELQKEDVMRDKAGMLYRVGVATSVNVNCETNGVWSVLPNRDQKWQLTIQNKGAQSLSFIFKKFILNGNSKFWVENNMGEKVSKVFTKGDMLPSFQQNIALCEGDNLTLVLVEEAYADKSEIEMDRVFFNYRSTIRKKEKINESASCEVNVNCSEGDQYQDEKRGVARIYIIEGNSGGFCSGSLVNNLAEDCKPLFLTALHCGINTSANDMALWNFYFNYEATSCSNPSSVGSLLNNYVTGCVRLADADDSGGETGSDFLLLQLGSFQNEESTITKLKSSSFNAFWNGWDANNTVSSQGVGIHHPAGDIKKISTYTSSLYSDTYGGAVSGTHWSLSWVSTQNGHGITEGGSSGSPLFTYNNGNSRIIGTLTGGSSYCDTPTDPDSYGKMSYHWSSNGSSSNKKASSYLDPSNSGVKVLDGSSDPCSVASLTEINISNDFDVYPNPSNDILYIKSSNSEGIAVTIYDLLGHEVFQSQTKQNIIEINLGDFQKGIYQVKISQGNLVVVKSVSKI